MTIYVDEAIHRWRFRIWCHLFSEDIDALHAFAAQIGMRKRWFQQPPQASWPHYDISTRKRVQALRLGARVAERETTLRIAHDVRLAWCLANRPDLAEWAAKKRDAWYARNATPYVNAGVVPRASDSSLPGLSP